MATTHTLYDELTKFLMNGTVDLDTDTLKVMLLSSGYTFSAAHTQLSSASGSEITGTGYTAGGASLSNVSISQTSGTAKFDADDTTWSNATFTCRGAVVYANVTRNGVTNPLISYILFDNTPADVGVTNGNFQIQWHTNGLIQLAKA